jgi:RsiW-degrading membrane proteinase PrsW (M82 family)
MNNRPGGALKTGDQPSFSEVFPLVISVRPGFMRRLNWPVIGPIVFTALVIFYLVANTDPLSGWTADGSLSLAPNTQYYLDLVGALIMYFEFYFIYMLCGKKANWLIFAGAAIFTYGFLDSPLFDHIYGVFDAIGGVFDQNAVNDLDGNDTTIFPLRFLAVALSVGLREEFTKAIPALAMVGLYFWTRRQAAARPGGKPVGLSEPLDGILICAAAAAAFSINETYNQYIYLDAQKAADIFNSIMPSLGIDVSKLDPSSAGDKFIAFNLLNLMQAHAFTMLLPRMLDNLSSHIAWSGIFGYCIGLFAMNPKRNWMALPIGWLTAAGLHGLWDASSTEMTQVLCALFSTLGLLAVIIKAREISPTRADNFASSVLPSAALPPGAPPQAPQAAAFTPVPKQEPVPQPAAYTPPAAWAASPAAFTPMSMQIGERTIPLYAGAALNAQSVPGLAAGAPDGRVALVEPNPKDAHILGLRNLSRQNWNVTLPDNQRIEVPPGKAMRLQSGARIDFGLCQAFIA